MATEILAGLCDTLGQTNRPMSVRRILKFARETGTVPVETTLSAVERALRSGVDEGQVRETRRGVYRLVDEGSITDVSIDQSLDTSSSIIGDSLSSTSDLEASVDDPDSEGGRGRRRRRSRRQRLADGPPIAPATIEAAAALSVRSKARSALTQKVWERVMARAELIVPPKEPGREQKASGRKRAPSRASAPVEAGETTLLASPKVSEAAQSQNSDASEDPRRSLRERMRARRKERSTAPAAVQNRESDSAVSVNEEGVSAAGTHDSSLDEGVSSRSQIRSRRRDRRIRASTDAALAAQEVSEPRGLYVERRQETGAAEPERRRAVVDEMVTTNAQAAAAVDVLRREGKAMSYGELVERVGTGSAGLKASILAENNRCGRAGMRRPFVVDQNGQVSLTEWGLSTRYLSLENEIASGVAEQREIVRRALLEAVSELEVEAFSQLLVVLLERLGYTTVTTVHRQAGNVAVTAQRKTTTGDETVAVVARQAWTSIEDDVVEILRESLAHFSAGSGLLLTVGNYAESAIQAARRAGVPTVRLLDGSGFARLLYDNGIGLTSHRLELSYVDAAFFASLAEG